MHAAPSVTYPVGRSTFALVLLAGLVAVAGAAAAAFHLQSEAGWRPLAIDAAVAACGLLALAGWLRSPSGRLRWDGVAWQWETGVQASSGVPEIAIDLQSQLLLRWRGDDRRVQWLWAGRQADPACWAALRRAVYSRASSPVPPAGEPPAAEQ